MTLSLWTWAAIGLTVVGILVTLHALDVVDVWAIFGLSATLLGAVLAYLSFDRTDESALSGGPYTGADDLDDEIDETTDDEANPDDDQLADDLNSLVEDRRAP